MLLPSSAWAEGEDSGGSDETSSTFFKYEDIDGGVSITGLNNGYPNALVIPAEIEGKKVVAIGSMAFYTAAESQLADEYRASRYYDPDKHIEW